MESMEIRSGSAERTVSLAARSVDESDAVEVKGEDQTRSVS
jgi:hypothetical protein